jgi:hypothetical protein
LGGRERLGEQLGAIGRAVVGHDALDGDAVPAEPGERALEEAGGVLLALGLEDLGVGQPAGVVDADMKDVEAGSARDAPGPVARDAMAWNAEAAELLGVEVDHLAGGGALVADRRRLGVEAGEPPRPSRRSTAPTVERGMPSVRAVAGPVIRRRRSRSISAARAAGFSGDVGGARSCRRRRTDWFERERRIGLAPADIRGRLDPVDLLPVWIACPSRRCLREMQPSLSRTNLAEGSLLGGRPPPVPSAFT